MKNTRAARAKINIMVSLGCQIISIICGLIVPRMMLESFGSEAYGATTSIAQFLSFITLLEGGIGGVARAALYKPLAEKNWHTVSLIVCEIKKFFRIVACIFIAYVVIIACSFKTISNVEVLDWFSTFLLVIIISSSTLGQYLIGISNMVLLQADQRVYITNTVSILATIFNTVFTVLLIHLGCGLIMVKLVSGLIFFLKPVALWLYVKKNYQLSSHPERAPGKIYLTQKWSGLGQHIAFFLHSNTDVAVLTVLSDLKTVAVYSVYHMIVTHIQNLVISFSSGMEALFGDMLAKEEFDKLHKSFGFYESMISVVSIILLGITSVMIVPFVRLYTSGIRDVNYIVPQFGLLLIAATFIYCVRMPYHAVVTAAGHFKRTRGAAYGEAAGNVLLSVLLVKQYGLIGVALGTLIATGFRFVYYTVYLSRNIIYRRIGLLVKRVIVNFTAICAVYVVGSFVASGIHMDNYASWIWCGLLVSLVAAIITCGIYILAYRSDFFELLHRYKKAE